MQTSSLGHSKRLIVLFSLLTLALTPVDPVVANNASSINLADFSDTSSLALNGSAAVVEGGPDQSPILRITPAKGNQAGSVFSQTQLNSRTFSSYFQFRISDPGGSVFDCNTKAGADGIVFVVQPISSDIGGSGAGIGYSGIDRSVGVEFDTWCNGGNHDPDSNHLAIDTNGSVVHESPEDVVSITPDFDDGSVWNAWVDYDGIALEVRVSRDEERPELPILVKELDISSILQSDTAYIGFTSGTGADWGNHDILVWKHLDHYSPIEVKERLTISVTDPTLPKVKKESRPISDCIYVILDASASMLKTTDNGSTRITVARSALEQLIKNSLSPSALFGMRVFGHRGSSNCVSELLIPVAPLAADSAIQKIQTLRSSSLGNTCLAEALGKAEVDLNALKETKKNAVAKKKIIVLTDGEETCGGDPLAAIDTMTQAGLEVELNIVGFAMEDDSLRSTYQNWTEATGGKYYDADNLDALNESLHKAASEPSEANPIGYEVFDEHRTTIGKGEVNGDSVTVKPGVYQVVVHTLEGDVTLAADATSGSVELLVPDKGK